VDPDALEPFGLALIRYLEGEAEATLTVRRDDGFEAPLPARHFFRSPGEFTSIEVAALERCYGNVLDIGAGTGLHALDLQAKGFNVTAIDVSPHAVHVMTQRGVADVRCANVFELQPIPFDTLLLLGHGIGIVEQLSNLSSSLRQLARLTKRDGQLLVHSTDVRATDEAAHLDYHDSNRRAGRYIGETRIRFEFRGHMGPYCGWLHVDPHTLNRFALASGWRCEVVLEQDGGEYLARLTPAS
jgi:SAM-dependent methyltransferase